jgi:hypothetical protein
MKLFYYTVAFSLIGLNLLLAEDHSRPSATNQYASVAGKIVADPATGAKIYADQLMIAFKENLSDEEKDLVLKNYDLRILSSAPSLNIYHVAFTNSEASLSKLHKKVTLLEQNSKILYVSPRKQIVFADYAAVENDEPDVQRSGEINFTQLNTTSVQYKQKTVNDVINQHLEALTSCLDRKKRLSKKYHGRLTFRLNISATGDVASVYLTKSSIRDKKLTSCLVKKINAWRDFPADPEKREKRTVSFSFEF